MGLLLLRAVVGLTAVMQAAAYLSGSGDWAPGAGLCALLLASSGASLLIGFLAPVVGIVVGLGASGILLSWLPAPPSTLADCRLAASALVAVSFAIACLGPGAFSLDSRLFGRREIVIPPVSPSARS